MIVITHFAAYCLTVIWQYLKKQYDKRYQENDTLKDITLGLTVNKFGIDKYNEINAVTSVNQLENDSFVVEGTSFKENSEESRAIVLKNKEITALCESFLKSEIVSVDSNIHTFDLKSVPFDKVTSSPKKVEQAQPEESQLVNKQVSTEYSPKDIKKESCDENLKDFSLPDVNTIQISQDTVETKHDIRFYPPVYIQRYVRAGDILVNPKWEKTIKKVVEFGCGEMNFFTMVLKHKKVSEIIEVDIDYQLLDRYMMKISPTATDYLEQRSTPLTVKVYSGNVAQINTCLNDTDAVIAIELIEHLFTNDLEDLPFTIFGFMQPKVALFTTPNADFNVLFPNFSGFRHFDHKFEWTRKQFEDWGHNIVSRYPDYEVSFEGIGKGPEGTEALGCCSQMALFERKTESKHIVDIAENKDFEGEYKLLHETEYPFYIDTRTEEQKILDTAESYIYRCRNGMWFRNDEIMEIRLVDVLANVKCLSLARLRDILVKANWEIIKSSAGDLLVKLPNTEDEIEEDWDKYDNVQDLHVELPETSNTEENWDCFQCSAFENEETPPQSIDVIDSMFGVSQEIESPKSVPIKPFTEEFNSVNDTVIKSESTLSLSSESNIYTPQQNSLYLPDLKVACQVEKEISNPIVKSYDNRPKSKTCRNLDTNEGPMCDEQMVYRSLNTLNENNVSKESLTEEFNNTNDITLKSESTLSISSESNIYTPRENSLYLPDLKIACQVEEKSFIPNVKSYDVTADMKKNDRLPTTYEFPVVNQQMAHTPLDIPNEKTDHNASVYKNVSHSSFINTDSNISVGDTDLSNTFRSCSDENDSDVFYTPMPTLKYLKKHGPIPSFKNAISENDSNESEDSLSPSDNVSFTNVKSKIPKCHSCPGSRQSGTANTLQRGNSCDVLACQQDSTSISKAGDSGYPNSNSEQTMDMDLTPEQVDELLTESDSSLGCDDDNSLPPSPVNPVAGQVMALIGDNVENGDVANNNRDGEGNNVIGENDGALFEFQAIIDEREEVHPLLAAVEGDLDSSDNEVFDDNNESDDLQDDFNVDVDTGSLSAITEYASLNSKRSFPSDLSSLKSEPILVKNPSEKSINKLLPTSSDQRISFDALYSIKNNKICNISVPTSSSLKVDDTSKIDSHITLFSNSKSEPHLLKILSEQSLDKMSSPHNEQISSFTENYENRQTYLQTSSSVTNTLSEPSLHNNPSITNLESEVLQNPSERSDQPPLSYNDEVNNFILYRGLDDTESVPTLVRQYSTNYSKELVQPINMETTGTKQQLNIESDNTKNNLPLASSSPVIIELSRPNSDLPLCSGVNVESVFCKKSLQKSFDDLPLCDLIISVDELVNIDNCESRDVTPLPSSCAIIEDLSIKDSQNTLCSEISSTGESLIFETSSESSFHELLQDSCVGNQQIDSDVQLPEDANPFPEWLLSILQSQTEDDFVAFGYGDIEVVNSDIEIEEREESYDVEGDIGGGGDPNTSQNE